LSADPAAQPPASVGALRGKDFRALIGRPRLLALVGLGALGAGLAAGIAAEPILGAIAAVGVAFGGLVVVYVVARRRAWEEFFTAFARERGLEMVNEGLPEVTPLLYAGSERTTNLALRGELGDGFDGTVAHYTYVERVAAGGGANSAIAYKLTVVLIDVPGMHGLFPFLLCHGRVGSQRTDALDDALRSKRRKRLEVESEAFDRRFEVFFDSDEDEVRMRRLFSPSLIVWLTESMPTAFELVNGHLCCFARDHLDSAAQLDAMIAGAVELAGRLQAEAAE
jgi:hypothetical protein